MEIEKIDLAPGLCVIPHLIHKTPALTEEINLQ